MKTLEDVCELLHEVIRNQESISLRLEDYDRQNDTLLNAKQAARFLGIGRTTFYEWKRQGRVKETVRNGRVGYLRRDLNEL